jgi:hypothetical protein
MNHRNIDSSFIKLITLACLISFSSIAAARDMTDWSDKTICRLNAEEPLSLISLLLKEIKTRGLVCDEGKVSGYTKSLTQRQVLTETVVGKKVQAEKKVPKIEARDKKLIASAVIEPTSNLPKCPSDTNASWHNCFGTDTSDEGSYTGEWKDGKENGQGTWIYDEGSYVGEWKDGEFHGQGTWSFDEGSYTGEWKDGKENGYGTLIYDEDSYTGEWKDGKENGQGTRIYDGNSLVGEWKDGKLDGRGTRTNADGTVEKVIWEDGKFQYVNTDKKVIDKKVIDKKQHKIKAKYKTLAPKEAALKIIANKNSISDWVIFWLAAVGGLILIIVRVLNSKQVELIDKPKIQTLRLQTDDPSLEELLEIDLAWPTRIIIRHIQTESEKWNGILNTMADGPEKESAQNMLNLIAEARKKYE